VLVEKDHEHQNSCTVSTLQHQFEQPSAMHREVASTVTEVEEKGSGLANAL